MQDEQIYIGIRRNGVWSALPLESVTEAELSGIDVHQDLRATLVVGRRPLAEVVKIIESQAARGIDPFGALDVGGHDCRSLEFVKARVRTVSGRARTERVRVAMEIPELWALELSPAVRNLLHELQHARSAPSLGQATATLRDALLVGLNELAREASIQGIDVSSEREREGTHVSPVVPQRRSEPSLR